MHMSNNFAKGQPVKMRRSSIMKSLKGTSIPNKNFQHQENLNKYTDYRFKETEKDHKFAKKLSDMNKPNVFMSSTRNSFAKGTPKNANN